MDLSCQQRFLSLMLFSVYEVIRVAGRVVALFYTPRVKPLQQGA